MLPRSRPSSRSGSDYRRAGPRDYPPRTPYFPEPGKSNLFLKYFYKTEFNLLNYYATTIPLKKCFLMKIFCLGF